MADLGFILNHVPLPAIIVIVYGSVVAGLSEQGRIHLATFVIMAMAWLTAMAKEMFFS